ncbi:MAG: electron transport complex subunit RsxG [Gammaproteobacteria bacterium]|jgi:electron transport complex protein RnfG|nr:electron transport complex subunit RsxG [Gammaproteobacteria bacterium]
MADTPVLKSGITLAVIAAICTALVASTYQLTHERIAANEQAWLEQSLQPALSGLFFDSGVSESRVTIPAPHALPGSEDAVIYRVYSGDTPVAALFVVSARDGYAGAIRLLIGVDIDGVVTGVHVLSHRETPGLGDRIESTKSDWVKQFDGRSLTDPQASGWKIRRDGGEFDQLTGASVTPRAIIKAIRETLGYFDANRAAVFAAPPDGQDETSE